MFASAYRRLTLLFWLCPLLGLGCYFWQHMRSLDWSGLQWHPLEAVSLGLLVLAFCQAIFRWDKRLRMPRYGAATVVFILASILLLAAAWLKTIELAVAAMLLFAFSFLDSQRAARSDQNLLFVWPLAVAGGVFLGVGESWFLQWTLSLVLSLGERLLDFSAVPHVEYPTAIELEGILLFGSAVATWIPLTVTVAITASYASCFKRSMIQYLAVAALTLMLTPITQAIAIATVGVAQHYFQTDLSEGTGLLGLVAACLLVFWLLFVSLERLLLGMLQPIPTKFLPDLANPLALIWNRITASKRLDSPQETSAVGQKLYATALLASVAVLIVASVQLSVNSLPENSSVASARLPTTLGEGLVAQDLLEQEFKQLDGLSARLWTRLNPLQTTEVVVFNRALQAQQAARLSAERGWNTKGRKKTVELSDDATLVYYQNARICSQLAYVDRDGHVTQQLNEKSELELESKQAPDQLTVLMLSNHVAYPTDDEIEALAKQFQQLVDTFAVAVN